jgi:FkbM family methyltransferase
LTRARHPFKDYLVGHYWWAFCKPRVWIDYDEGHIINVCLGEYIQQRIFFDRYYERPLIEWLKATLRPDDVFWDVGANIGAISLVAAPRCRRVVAFEPDPRSVQRLTRNLSVNSISNVDVISAALAERNGTSVLYQADGVNTGMSSIAAAGSVHHGAVDVRTLTADDFLDARSDLAPTVMKLDVEGAETHVLAGATRVLGSGRLRALVFEDRVGAGGEPTTDAVVSRLTAAGFRVQGLGASAESVGDGMFNFLATRPALVAAHGA